MLRDINIKFFLPDIRLKYRSQSGLVKQLQRLPTDFCLFVCLFFLGYFRGGLKQIHDQNHAMQTTMDIKRYRDDENQKTLQSNDKKFFHWLWWAWLKMFFWVIYGIAQNQFSLHRKKFKRNLSKVAESTQKKKKNIFWSLKQTRKIENKYSLSRWTMKGSATQHTRVLDFQIPLKQQISCLGM